MHPSIVNCQGILPKMIYVVQFVYFFATLFVQVLQRKGTLLFDIVDKVLFEQISGCKY